MSAGLKNDDRAGRAGYGLDHQIDPAERFSQVDHGIVHAQAIGAEAARMVPIDHLIRFAMG